jgi:ssDNA-binding Zn-finger/Zn-ribbon topoisomerase 1
MAIIQNELPCPFCQTRNFTLNAFVNDEYEPGFDPDNATRRVVNVSCKGCGRVVLHIKQAVDDSTRIRGISRCPRCNDSGERNTSNLLQPSGDIGVCPKCGSTLQDCWWTWSAEIPEQP